MREIKFRVWDCHTKEMAGPKGLRIDFDNGVIDHIEFKFSDYGSWGNATRPLDQERYKVMQFTGLHDKNGKEIYEGDIVRVNNRYRRFPHDDLQDLFIITQIEFSNGSFWFRGGGYTDCNWHHYGAEHLEVIGNIYEHTELLEAK